MEYLYCVQVVFKMYFWENVTYCALLEDLQQDNEIKLSQYNMTKTSSEQNQPL